MKIKFALIGLLILFGFVLWNSMITEAIAATGAAGAAGIGKVMAVIKPKLAGRADLAAASAQVKARLTT